MKKAIVFVLLTVLLICTACGNPLVGKWRQTDSVNEMEFHQDGTVTLIGAASELTMRYRAKGDTLHFTDDAGMESEVTYTLEGDTLTTYNYNDVATTYTRVTEN